MKLIIVNNGRISINADTVTKIEREEEAVYCYTKNSDKTYLIGWYNNENNTNRAFRCVNEFITNESSGCMDITGDEKLESWEHPMPEV